MKIFRERLRLLSPREDKSRAWFYIAYDQLSDRVGPLSRRPPDEVGVVLIESLWRPALRPYHKQKLALVLANQRHFALEQAARGVAVRYLVSRDDYAAVLRGAASELGPLGLMRPAEYELRTLLAPLVEEGILEVVAHEGWMTTSADFEAAGPRGGPWRQDAFYRAVRQRTGILMEEGTPTGGKYSLDADNRRAWKGDPPAPTPPAFEPDEVTQEVVRLVESRFAHHPGRVDPAALPATLGDAERMRIWARDECLESFGPFEDAMSAASRGLFHTRLSPLVNLHRILPADVVADALAADVPLNSKEGLIRQVIGWREFVRHVHEATEGFRTLGFPRAGAPGTAGWDHWTKGAWSRERGSAPVGPDGGVAPATPGGELPVLPVFWGRPSGLHCLDTAVTDVMDTAWTHHTPRLMVLSNLATLIGVSPRALTDWFWVAFIDAYDWVVEPNVLAMGTFGVGEVMTTKPYISGSAYIDRMSDFCRDCAFHPKRNCPVTRLYWAYLWRNRERLRGNHRVSMPLRNVEKRGEEARTLDRRTFEWVREALAAGRPVIPDEAPR